MRKKLIGYGIGFIILTGLFFYFVFAGTDNWKVKLPVISYVRPFSFTNQDGRPVDENDLKGKVTVVQFFLPPARVSAQK